MPREWAATCNTCGAEFCVSTVGRPDREARDAAAALLVAHVKALHDPKGTRGMPEDNVKFAAIWFLGHLAAIAIPLLVVALR